VADIEMQDLALPEDQQIDQGNPVDNPHDVYLRSAGFFCFFFL
jgi:hypothetical protein